MTKNAITIIEARPRTFMARLLGMWQHRTFYPFLFKELMTRKFRNTLLGFWWLIIRPLVPTTIFIVVFTFVRPIESDGLPYPIFFLSGMMTWTVFSSAVTFLPRTLMWMRGLMRRTYFPRLLVPLAALGPPLIEFLVILTLFAGVVVSFTVTDGQFPLELSWNTTWFVACIFMALLFGVSIGMVASVVALFIRDVIFSVPYFAQMLMFLTPVIYPVTFLPEPYRWILYLNPMATIVEVSRWSLTGQGEFDPRRVVLAFGAVILVFTTSVVFFLRAEPHLNDVL